MTIAEIKARMTLDEAYQILADHNESRENAEQAGDLKMYLIAESVIDDATLAHFDNKRFNVAA